MRLTSSAAAVLSLGLLLGACSGEPTGDAPATSSATPSATPTAAEEPTPAPTAAAKGTAENPATPDVDTVVLGEDGEPVFEVTLSAANFAAWDVISAHYQFNDPAPEGSSYVLLPVAATYVGSGPLAGHAWVDLGVTFVAADGRTFEPSPAMLPDDLSTTPELATGESARGNLSFVVPDDALAGGTWHVVNRYFESGGEAWFTAV